MCKCGKQNRFSAGIFTISFFPLNFGFRTTLAGGGVWGVFLTSVLMLMFWPTGWVMLRRLRIKINHPSRISRFPNVGESAMRAGLPLLGLSLYLGTQSLSCLVYEGVTDCTLKNSGEVKPRDEGVSQGTWCERVVKVSFYFSFWDPSHDFTLFKN